MIYQWCSFDQILVYGGSCWKWKSEKKLTFFSFPVSFSYSKPISQFPRTQKENPFSLFYSCFALSLHCLSVDICSYLPSMGKKNTELTAIPSIMMGKRGAEGNWWALGTTLFVSCDFILNQSIHHHFSFKLIPFFSLNLVISPLNVHILYP